MEHDVFIACKSIKNSVTKSKKSPNARMDNIADWVKSAVEIAQQNQKKIELIRNTLINHDTKLEELNASCSKNSSRIKVVKLWLSYNRNV